MNIFVRARLMREIQEDEPWRYELMHEYLIDRINQVTGKVMDATQRANRLLKQYASNYLVDGTTRIPINKLWFIRRYSDVARGERERELMKKSLRWGLMKAGVLTLLLFMGATIAAAALSVSEDWEGVRLSDGHTAAARKAVFSPDGRLLVTCGEDGRIIVWDFARRERLATFSDNSGWVNSVAFSPDGKWFAAPSANQTVTVWDASRLERAVVLEGHRSTVNVVVFSPDGRLLGSISGGDEGKTLVWDTSRWEEAYELPRNAIWADLAVSPDGRRMLICNQVWALQTASMTRELDPDLTFAAFSPDGRRLVGIGGSGTVVFFDVERLWEKAQFRVLSSQRTVTGSSTEVWVLTNANGMGGTPAWIQLLPSGAPPFSNGLDAVVYDTVTNRLIVYGGCFANCSPALSNVWVLTNANGLGGSPAWSQNTVTNLQSRTHHPAVFDSVNNLLIPFGGHFAFFGTDQNDTRTLSNANGVASPSTWSTLSTAGGPPPIRNQHTAVYDQANNRMTIFAGTNYICCPNHQIDKNDVWVLANANGSGVDSTTRC